MRRVWRGQRREIARVSHCHDYLSGWSPWLVPWRQHPSQIQQRVGSGVGRGEEDQREQRGLDHTCSCERALNGSMEMRVKRRAKLWLKLRKRWHSRTVKVQSVRQSDQRKKVQFLRRKGRFEWLSYAEYTTGRPYAPNDAYRR